MCDTSINQLINKQKSLIKLENGVRVFVLCVLVQKHMSHSSKTEILQKQIGMMHHAKKRKIEKKNPYASIKCHYQKIAVIEKRERETEREIEKYMCECLVAFYF